MKIALVSKKSLWSDLVYERLIEKFDCSYFNDDSYEDFLVQADWVFFFHWSKIVSDEVYKNNKCVVIHTGNLPKGRGGSPLQNQILDGIVETKVNAITMEDDVDSGDIYCSLPLTLQGTITDIWLSIADRAYELIKNCVINNPKPTKQEGEVQQYKRNKNNMLPIDSNDIIDIHKFIQMLDGDTYPSAFLNVGNYRLEFSRSKIDGDEILSDVKIRRVNE
ncbi:methionyl-tRNA formyltransferase [Candidatus Pacearchaeota archaeon]|jgi:methionyl-tRNA formyltransferase|nr:methionyl-tRNA formyltransferase [Candidatus Pacearchaeota archaeon]|tara:strand:- start:2756 stop:3415 length:660 start_codon:yes stop_codon:yes gene_type:complete